LIFRQVFRTQLPERPEQIAFRPEGSQCIVVTRGGQVSAFDCARISVVGRLETGLKYPSLVIFENGSIAVAGLNDSAEYNWPHLTVTVLDRSLVPSKRIDLGLCEATYTSTVIVDEQADRILIANDLLRLLNLRSGMVEDSLEDPRGFVVQFGVIYDATRRKVYAVRRSQGLSWLTRYCLSNGGLRETGLETTFSGGETVGGAALAPSGTTVAVVTMHDHNFIKKQVHTAHADEYGRLYLVSNDSETLAIPLRHAPTRDLFERGFRDVEALALFEYHPSNPVFLSETEILVGDPGGRVILYRPGREDGDVLFQSERPIATLGLFQSYGIAVGDHFGGLELWQQSG
jgi:hypothetical protein